MIRKSGEADFTHRSDWMPTKVHCRHHHMQQPKITGSDTPFSKVQCISEGNQKCTAGTGTIEWKRAEHVRDVLSRVMKLNYHNINTDNPLCTFAVGRL